MDSAEDEDPTDPRLSTVLATCLTESAALTPYLTTWLMSSRVGTFSVCRERNGALSVSTEVTPPAPPRLLPVPGN